MSAASDAPLKIIAVLGTVREGRLGSRVGKFVIRGLEEKGHHVELLDPMAVKFPLLEKRTCGALLLPQFCAGETKTSVVFCFFDVITHLKRLQSI